MYFLIEAWGAMVIINKLSQTSSNSEPGCCISPYTNDMGKRMSSQLLLPSYR